ncbi:MAG: Ankyrin [Berkelbacteria bacterium GW2011_GWA1_36_9]|uniref:Ankyrin n=1 Tax=Berkelbacteria bacterium GW2011_GWA1_36_9 TaxID=1618331 RepID=A0A0G0FVQ3_9BACT|nr:MAG: Ankyrin [Berkelbacteria bacterium GW2011_GWA1_36_9]
MMEQKVEQLIEAVKMGSLEDVQKLLSQGVDVNSEEYGPGSGGNSLLYAIDRSNEEMVALLVENGADVHYNRSTITPLNLAVQKTRNLVKYLIAKGADVNLLDSYGNAPLHHLAKTSNIPVSIEIAELLIEKGADINLKNSKGKTSLELAVGYGCIIMAEFFYQHGAIWNRTDDPVDSAIINHRKSIVSNIYSDRYD